MPKVPTQGYYIYRSVTPEVPTDLGHLLSTIYDPSQTRYVDTTLSSVPSQLYYKVVSIPEPDQPAIGSNTVQVVIVLPQALGIPRWLLIATDLFLPLVTLLTLLVDPLARAVSSALISGSSPWRFLFPWRPRRRRNSWGQVLDDRNKLPVVGAKLALVPEALATSSPTAVADTYGEFGFSLGTPATYHLAVQATGYSSHLGDPSRFGKTPPKPKLSVHLLRQAAVSAPVRGLVHRFARVSSLFTVASYLLYLGGLILNISNIVRFHDRLSWIFLGIYLVLLLLELATLWFVTLTGYTADPAGAPCPGVTVSAFRMDRQGTPCLAAATYSDRTGHYHLKLTPGTYQLAFAKDGINTFTSERLVLSAMSRPDRSIQLEPASYFGNTYSS